MYKRAIRILLLVLITALLPLSAHAAFNARVDGFDSYSSALSGVGVRAVAIQPWDGKILIGGDFSISHGDPPVARQHLARLNSDGTVDTGFTPSPDGPVNSIVIQANGADPAQSMILIGGSFTEVTSGGPTRKGLARLASGDGSLDPLFNPVSTTDSVTINAMALRPDGLSIVVGGKFPKLKPDHPTPNLAGIVVAGADPLGSQNWSPSGGIIADAVNEVNAILLQGGQVVVGGRFDSSGASDIARFNADGSFDDQFNPPSPGGPVRALALQSDGRIVLAGSFPAGGAVRRLNGDGTMDGTFNQVFDAGGSVSSLVVQPDGRILVAGAFTSSVEPELRRNLARLKIDGTLEAAVFRNLDGPVNVVLRQPDGNILAGGEFTRAGEDETGAGRPRAMLARFYPHGALDDDIPVEELALDYAVQAISLHPEGVTIAGLFENVQGLERIHIARLKENWFLDTSFNETLMILASVYVLAPMPEGALLVGGNFPWPYNTSVLIDAGGDPYGPQTLAYNETLSAQLDVMGESTAIALLPPDAPLPVGGYSDEGMMYLAARFLDDVSFQSSFLSRIKSDGLRDDTFQPASVDERTDALALQSDGKLLVGTESGKLMRLLITGAPDPAWNGGVPLQLGDMITSIVQQKDGRILVTGYFADVNAGVNQDTGDPVTWNRNILRLNSDGTKDNSFNVEASFVSSGTYTSNVVGSVLQADGKILIYGVFDRVLDGRGVLHVRDNVARLTANGELDSEFDLGSFAYDGGPIGNVSAVNLQQDGKLVLGGHFVGVNSSPRRRLARFANGWAREELSVAANGSSITWLREGTGPEVSRVTFEFCADPDDPAAQWTFLGNGHRIEGGWRLDGLDLTQPQYGLEANRYVRARGYAAGEKGGAGSLVESVRLYYLQEVNQSVLTVTVHAQSKTYGDPDPVLTYSASGFVNGDTSAIMTGSLERVAGANVGSYAIGQGTLSAGANYTIAFTGADLSITPAPLTVAATAQTKTYGAADPAPLGYTVSGYVNGDTVAIFTGSLNRAGGEEVGSYAIGQGTLSAGANYTITFTGADLSITPAPLAVAATAQSKSYGAADPSPLGYTASGYVNGDTVAIFTGTLTRAAGESVGSYAISQGTLSAGSNYTIAFTGSTLTITPASLTIAAIAQTKTYGASDPSPLSLTVSGYVNGDTAAILTGSLTRAAGENVGSYAINQGTLSAGANYTIAFTGSMLTITPASLTIAATAQGKTYGGSDPSPLGYTVSGYVNGDTAAILTGSLARAAGENVGSYAISQGTLSAGSNYTIAFTGSILTITPASLTIAATAQSKTYGASDPSPLGYTVSGYVNGDTAAILTGSLTRAAGENVGNYAISQGTVSAGANYTIAYTGSSLTITPAVLTITANAQTKTYGGSDPSPLSYSVSGYVNGDTAAILTGTLTRAAGENVGNYAISQGTVSAGPNYTIAFTGSTLTITPAALIIAATAQIRTYGAPDPSPLGYTVSGYVNGDTAAILTGSLTRAAGENVGSYAISQGTLSAGANYTIAFTGSTLTITPAPLTIAATAHSKIYGASDPSPLGYTVSGYVNGDTAAILTGSLTRAPGETVGSYAIGQGTLSAGPNYTIAFTGVSLTIAQASLAVTATAHNKTYGSADPDPLGYNVTGFLNSDSAAILTGSLARAPGENVGSYAIGQGTLSAGPNYSITFVGANLTITAASLTVTATPHSKIYGAADPNPFGYTASGYLNGDTAAILTGSLTRAAGENVGSYAIGQGTLSAGANYSITFTGAALTITPAPLTISAENKERPRGAPNPELTATYQGLVNFDSIASLGGLPSLTTSADESSAVGNYPITASLGSITSSNYTYSFVPGILTITAGAQQTITFNPLRPKTFGDGDFDPGATASSGLPVTYASSAPAIASIVGDKIRVLAPGSTELTASQAGNQQYEPAADVTRTLIVNPPPWNGLGFDGSDDRMQIQDAPQFNFGNKTGFSIETWLRLDGSQPDGTGLLSKGEGGSPWSGYQLILHQNRIAAEIGDGTATLGVPAGLIGTSTLNDGQWHHVALTVDRVQATAALYLDGRLEAQVANPALGLDPDSAGNLQVGVDRTGTHSFKGRIDELRLWDSARSREEVRNVVSQIIDPQDEPHLVAYYHFDEGDVGLDNAAFTTAPERTAHGAHAVLQGFALSGADSNWILSGAFIPLLETAPIGSISSNAATGGGTVYPNYYPATDVGLCWGTVPNPGLGDTCSRSGSGSGAYVTALTGLTPGVTYHVRAFATNQMGTAYGNDLTFQTARLPQHIDFAPLADRTYGDAAVTLSGSASSGLPVSYTSSNPAVAVVANGEIRIRGAGTTVITASQPGNETYSPAIDVPQSLTVLKKALSVTADNKSRVYLGANPTLTASYAGFVPGEDAGVISGAPELSTTATPVSPVGEYPIMVALGTLAAANYSFVLSDAILTVRPAAQSISFGPIADRTYGDAAFQAGGSAASGLPISYTSSNPAAAVVVDGEIRITGAGSTVITASQAGNESFEPALDVPQSFTVRMKALTLTAEDKSRVYLSANPTLTASYQGFVLGEDSTVISGTPDLSTTATAASPVGEYPILVGLGTLAAQNYSFVLVNGTLTIRPASQSIAFNPLRSKTFGDGDFDPGATASSGLPVTYASSAPAIASVVGGRIRVLAPGSTNIIASQTGDQQYEPAAEVTRTLIVNPPPWNGLGFDGSDDRLQILDAPQLNFGNKTGFSIETWLRLDGSQPDGVGLVSKGEGGSPWSGYQLILHQNRIAAEIGDGTATLGVPDGLIGTSTLNDGQWHHVALSVDLAQTTAALYLDGRLEAQVANPALGLDPDSAGNLQVGVDRTGTHSFKGRIDELRLWDSARTREEIRNAVSQIIDQQDEPHLVAYYHLDEGDVGLDNSVFTTAPERTAHGAHATLQGFALSGVDSNWVRSGAFIPLLESAPINSISSNAATGGGTVYPNYYPATDFGLCWGTTPNPGLGDTCSRSGSGSGPFVAALTGLTPGITYHVRAFATNLMGTAYGNDITFQAARLAQTINFAPLADRTYGDAAVTLNGSASSGLPLTYTSSNPAVAVAVNGEIRIRGAGNTVITASQPGNETYSPAADVPRSFTVLKKALSVTADDKSRAYRTPNPTLTASYQGFIAGEDRAVISGTPSLSTAAGLESAVENYDIVTGIGSLAAENYQFVLVNGTLTVFQSCQEIIFPPVSDRTYGDPPFALIASACSGLALSFTSSDPQVAQVNGKVLTVTGAGSTVITARQQGTGDLEPPPEVSRTLVVHKSGQELSFAPLGQKVLGDAPFALNATASSALAVSYQSSDPGVASVSGSEVTIVGAGTTVITAWQEGNGNYNAALPASQPLTVVLEGTAPLLTLSTLPSGAVTADPVLNVMGSASDTSGIAGVTVNVEDLTARAGLFSTAVPLAIGDNSVSVVARDGAGNVTTRTIAIVLDATAPAIALAEPADNSVTGVPHFTASGRVAPGSSVTLAVNGAPPRSLAVSGGGFTGSGYLEPGVNTITVTATLSGRSSMVKRSLTYAPGNAAVAITDPAEDIRTERKAMTIRGTVGSSGAANVILNVDGTSFTLSLQDGAFQQEISLEQPGQHRVSATVTGSDGNLSVAHRNVISIDRIMGDLNFDGLVDIEDAAALLRIALDMEPATAQALSHGDLAPLVNGVSQPDGRIDVGDVLVLLRMIVGLVD